MIDSLKEFKEALDKTEAQRKYPEVTRKTRV